MSRKQWTVTAVIILAIVVALSIYYVPRRPNQPLKLPDDQPVFIQTHVSGSVHEPVKGYRTSDAGEMEAFVSLLRELRVTYLNRRNIYQVGEVGADVSVVFDDGSTNGSSCYFFISDNGLVRYNDNNYRCEDTAALEALLTQIQSWELFYESEP